MIIRGFNSSNLQGDNIEIQGHNSGDIIASGRVSTGQHNSGDITAEEITISGHNSGDITANTVRIRQHNSGDIRARKATINKHNSGDIDADEIVVLGGHNAGTVWAKEITYQGWRLTRDLLETMQKTIKNKGLKLSKENDHWTIEDKYENVGRIEIKENKLFMYHLKSGTSINVNGTRVTIAGGSGTVIVGKNGDPTIIN